MKLAVIGTSWITESFIESFLSLENTALYAVYSRSREKADLFAEKHGAERAFTSLEEMAKDINYDSVYIASPNIFHYEQAKLFLQHGKNVICEKPLCVEPEQINELYAIADAENIIFCEAIMNLHSPDTILVKEALKRIGTVHSAFLDFSQLSSKYPSYLQGKRPNIFLPEMGAGCLMDLGVYSVYLSCILFGFTDDIKASAIFLDTGADCSGAAILSYPDSTVTLTYSKTAQSRIPSQIIGDKGAVLIDSVSQIGNSKIVFNDRSESIIVKERTRKEIMRFEAEDFIAYTSGKFKYVPYETAKKASVDVSVMMKFIRENCGKFLF